ncbi:MAG: YHS domain-containing protein [Candidatus Jettenia sp.]|uniref:TRASH domain-containing protein n=1 Tax=Candidatus Jettenia caeni TaxID=247490 RepID=I3INF3_9BACT|nr:YHS domain-containing protein [Candidatus Jettenia sp. AMX1]MBC6927928.1 YHS domain-containing protein [Candidatus Jettenia sp.]NUN21845.1 YHS domain-containing protein [Candidatus Jettenia caeni]KAA0248249.1 MAG: YHS domain-containing protein [Candidatus Jettenia sp. AMX1]MCE7879531.1 YHS domain-containing protein [Candidatus Jettenia sp. AMX1]MDL1937845.1 YHS domain-containing protein [Candidatus Jettenia sp. AMX1]
MNTILRTVLVSTFVIGLSGTYASKVLWACGGSHGSEEGHGSHKPDGHVIQAKAEAVKDPVCGMEVGDTKKALSEEYKGNVYYFCSEQCKKTFKKDPASYTTPESQQHIGEKGHKH